MSGLRTALLLAVAGGAGLDFRLYGVNSPEQLAYALAVKANEEGEALT